MKNEIWKPVIIEKSGVVYDFTGLYEVSSEGRVRSLNYNRTGEMKVLKRHRNNCGYSYVGLQVNGKQENFLVGRLVATAFIPNPNGLPEVNHIKEFDKDDNSIRNLEWCDRSYNANYGTRTERQMESMVNNGQTRKVICLETGEVYPSTRKAGREIGVSATCINDCCKGNQTTCNGYHFMYHDEYLKASSEEIDSIKNKKTVCTCKGSKVVCLETNKKFGSIKEAEEWLGLTGIGACCRGKCKTIGGLHWMYLTDYIVSINNGNDDLLVA